MKRKTKEGSLNLFYMDEVEQKKNNTKKQKAKKSSNNKSVLNKNTEKFNFDNEIIIGVNVHSNKNVSKSKDKNNKNSKNTHSKRVSDKDKKNKKADNSASRTTNLKVNKKSKRKNIKFIKYFVLMMILTGAIICFLLSPIFNIKSIKISNNLKFSEDKYISLSKIQLETNIFNISKKDIINNIKQNPYIETAEIKRKLPDEILIIVKERQATYMIEHNGSYIYMNNQGYFLEINDEALKVPIIKGIITNQEEFQVGNRLCLQDLKKMEKVLEIASYATSYNLLDKITIINIEDKNNYILEMKDEEKIVYLGDASNINERMLKLPLILEREKGNKGDIMLDMDLTKKDPYFSPQN